MRVVVSALLGMSALFVAGFLKGGEDMSRDPDLLLGTFYALAGLGMLAIVAAGVALGVFTALFSALISPAYATAAAFAVLIAVLVLRPGGLSAGAMKGVH